MSTIESALLRDSLIAREIGAYLALPGIEIFRVGLDVGVRFSRPIEAEEFHKLLLAQKGRAGK